MAAEDHTPMRSEAGEILLQLRTLYESRKGRDPVESPSRQRQNAALARRPDVASDPAGAPGRMGTRGARRAVELPPQTQEAAESVAAGALVAAAASPRRAVRPAVPLSPAAAALAASPRRPLPPSARRALLEPDVASQRAASRAQGCNCRKSRCLKLYCQCFAAGAMCRGCNCNCCLNTEANLALRQEAVRTLLERNPNAFECKFTGGGAGKAKAAHRIGCRCKKTHCLKKYCECFQSGVLCGDNCACLECRNTAAAGSPSAPAPPHPQVAAAAAVARAAAAAVASPATVAAAASALSSVSSAAMSSLDEASSEASAPNLDSASGSESSSPPPPPPPPAPLGLLAPPPVPVDGHSAEPPAKRARMAAPVPVPVPVSVSVPMPVVPAAASAELEESVSPPTMPAVPPAVPQAEVMTL